MYCGYIIEESVCLPIHVVYHINTFSRYIIKMVIYLFVL